MMPSSEFWVQIRHGLLIILGALEKWMIKEGWLKGPTTSELRELWKKGALT